MKSQWHDSLVKTDALRKWTEPGQVPRELDLINHYLKEVGYLSYVWLYTFKSRRYKFEMPSWVGRLPSDVGYPAAGSLSADEYKAMALVYLPVIVSVPSLHSLALQHGVFPLSLFPFFHVFWVDCIFPRHVSIVTFILMHFIASICMGGMAADCWG